MKEEKGTVCVTGGTGYVASWLVMRLLERGYSVRATVRSHPERKKDVSYLTNLAGAADRLNIINADLSQPESFNAAIEGCIGVFHVAHPMNPDGDEDEETVTKIATEGMQGILRACMNSKSVKRVVYTSTAASVMYNDKGLNEMDENTWSDLDICTATGSKCVNRSYLVSKTVTEKMALDFGAKHGLDVVTIVLPLVVGPFICPSVPSSVYLALAVLFGNKDIFEEINTFYLVHIDDATSAHIFLLEHPLAKGRYICCSMQVAANSLVEFLSTKYKDDFKIPDADLKKIKDSKTPSLSSLKLSDLGFKFEFGLEEMFDGSIRCCKDKCFL